ncbi:MULTISPECIES: PAS domain S-box protein [unclassified Roseofilum]|uniref:PAS domain S-box protein n=1 Tax=unclassified Roseofilum TaxID=2620099 RepID=UPI001B29B59A|nr:MULTISPECIES: PAS domain S-box protein [unclassified Roseofilum]MBP0010857.1 PAS domain S-box protein [Roseofilum sp. Belize Diploria]MBP0033656.1 PAS domain S-box protein [Roseofilum sp. Belize BBD 4]
MVFPNYRCNSLEGENRTQASERFRTQLATDAEIHQALSVLQHLMLIIDLDRHQIKVIPTDIQADWVQLTVQELSREGYLCAMEKAIATQTPQSFQYQLTHTNQLTRSFQAQIYPYADNTVLWVAQPHASLSPPPSWPSLLAEITLKIRQSLDVEEILEVTTTEVCKLLQTDRALILQLQKDGSALVIQESVVPGWIALLGHKIYDPCFRAYEFHYLQGRIGQLSQIETLCKDSCYRDLLDYFQVQSNLVIPIISQDKLWGFIVLHQCSHPRDWQSWEIDFINQLGNQVGIAINQSEILKKMQVVAQKLTFHFENSPLAVIEWNHEFRVSQWSPQAEHILGWDFAEVQGQHWSQFPFIFDPDLEEFKESVFSLIDGSQDRQICSYRNLTKTGQVIYCQWYHSVLRDREGNVLSILSLVQDVSDRHKAETALRQSEAHFRITFEQSPIGMSLNNLDGTAVQLNQAYLNLLGYSFAELKKLPIRYFIHPDDLHIDQALYQQLIDRKIDHYTIEKRLINKSKEIVYTLFKVALIYDDNGDPLHLISQVIDISDRQQVEESLRQSEERWQLAIQGNHDGIWDWNVQTNQVFFSPRWKEMLGYSDGEISNDLEEWTERIHPDDFPWAVRAIRKHFNQETPFYMHEHRLQCKDGSYKWILDRGRALWDEAGNVLRMVGSHTDISDRKQAEQELQQTQNFLQTIIDYLPVAVFVKEGRPDKFGQFKLWNKTCERIFGLTAEQAVGSTDYDWFPWEQADGFVCKDREVLARGEPEEILEERVDSYPLGQRILHTIKVPIYGEEYEPEYLLCISEDITDRKQAEAALRESEARYSSLTNDVLDKSAVGIFILDANFKVVWVNQTLENFFGIHREEIIGRDKRELIRDRIQYFFADPQQFKDTVLATYDHNTYTKNFECHILPASDRQERWLEHLSQPIESGLYTGGRIEHYTDISDRKSNEAELHRLNRALHTLSNCNQAIVSAMRSIIVRSTYETDLLQNICDILVNLGGYRLAWIGYVQQDTEKSITPMAKAGYEEGYLDQLHITWADTERGRGPTGTAARTGQLCAFQNILTNPHYTPWRTQAKQRGYRSSIALPLKTDQGVFAVLNLYSSQPDAFDASELQLLCELSEDITYGIIALRTHHAHAESEEKFRQLTENTDDVFWMTTASLDQILYVSPAYERIWGRTQQSLYERPQSFVEAIHPRDRPRISAILQSSYTFDLEYRIRQPNGNLRWIWDRGFPIFDANGKVYRRAGIAKDITTRKETEELLRSTNEHLEVRVAQRTAELASANHRLREELEQRQRTETQLRNSHKQYRTLVQNFPQGAVFLFDRQFRYTIADGVGLAAMGLDGDRLEGQLINQVLPADLLQNTEFIYHSALVGQTVATEITYQERTYHYRANPLRNEQGQIFAGMVVMQDITAQKQSKAILEEAERRWRTLLENVRLLVVGLDRQGNIEYVNPFFAELTGYKASEIIGKNWFDTLIPAHACSKVRRAFQAMLTPEGNPHYQHTLLTQSGEEKKIAWNNTQLHNAQGEEIGTMSIGEDITERYAIERMKDEFISVVSHELRTPLTSIHGGLNLLSTGLVDPSSAKGKHVIDIAAESAERLVRLVNDILELERLESGKIRLQKQAIAVNELLRLAVEQMQVMASRARVTLVVSEQTSGIEFYADLDRMLQVLTNLLSNAIKFSDPGSQVRLTAILGSPSDRIGDRQPYCSLPYSPCWDSPHLIFTIEDWGRGIPEDKLESIFERFHQVDASDSRRKGGTGLGLAICRSIVEQHGGRIWVESQLNQGSRFSLCLSIYSQREG